eukprot:gene1943-2378_t
MRFTTKGGVWKNTEDEILKVAVMKYGIHQWARISSLLVRKSPAQCKARWYEWLDPNIKKTDWSKEEEEKLLHLAKIFPSQWKTIAPLVGRTASQCLEHYNRLLDEVQEKDGGATAAGDDPRRLRAGEMEPNPETKPAKPDPIDMDEDEKETLSEAKARLSNTHGKKEKRKFREKQLEEARRLAFLQKKRELKAAGINYHERKKPIKGYDLKNEIPNFRQPPAGFYEVPDHERRNDPNKDQAFIGKRLDQIENPNRKNEDQERLNKIEESKKKKKELTNLPELIMETSRLNDPEQMRRPSKMVLPAPQLTEDDLQEIANFEQSNNQLADDDSDPNSATRALVGNYPSLAPTPSRTVARTPMREDTVMMEAQNLLALTNAQTPLKGGSNPSLQSQSSSTSTGGSAPGSTPAFRTPNPLMQSMTPRHNKLGMATPQTSRGTTDDSEYTRSEEKHVKQTAKNNLLSNLKSLPAPSNKYVLSLPQEQPSLEEFDDEERPDVILDNSEIHIREQQELKRKEQFKLRNRSSALKKDLPRPTNYLNNTNTSSSSQKKQSQSIPIEQEIQNLIQEELNQVIAHDNRDFPVIVNGVDVNSSNNHFSKKLDSYQYFTTDELKEADQLLKEEMKQIETELNSNGNIDQYENFVNQLESTRNQYLLVPKENVLIEKSKATNQQIINSIQSEFEVTLNQIKQSSIKSVNLEKKLNIYHGGYQNRSTTMLKQIGELYQDLEKNQIDLECFQDLYNNETSSKQNRIKKINNDLYDQVEVENKLQSKYLKLSNEKRDLLRKLQQQQQQQQEKQQE